MTEEMNFRDLNVAHQRDTTVLVLYPKEEDNPMRNNKYREEISRYFQHAIRNTLDAIYVGKGSNIYFRSYRSKGIRGIRPDFIVLINRDKMKTIELNALLTTLYKSNTQVRTWRV